MRRRGPLLTERGRAAVFTAALTAILVLMIATAAIRTFGA